LLALMFFQGAIVAVSTLGAFAFEYLGSGDATRARAVAFAASILAQNVQAFNVRSNRLSIFQLGLFSNRYLVGAFSLVLITLLVLIYVPVFQPIFETTPLTLRDWALIGGLALLPLVVMEIVKFVWRAGDRRKNQSPSPL
ncbi:MAG: cation-translocating P-type ATPase C-terminal domain-containing protein, partial [Chloroflexi bacterium]|nr:cation-translocating P-type ATPase C-terminal domain-containing protein [Chloroflexota bacterium]